MAGLSTAEVAAYQRDGVLSPHPALSVDEVAGALDALALIDATPPELRRGLVTHKTHLVSKTLAAICMKPEIVDRVASLIGPNVLVWASSLFIKEARSPSFVSWHQDAAYWGLGADGVVTAWVAFTPSNPESGCMRVAPGSHLWPTVEHKETFAEANLLSRGQEIATAVDPAQARDVTLKPGEMSLHHVNIAHSSEPNRSDHRRIGYAIRYVAAHVRPPTRDCVLIARGAIQDGLYDVEPAAAGELLPDDLTRHARSLAGNRIAPAAKTG